MPQPKATRTSLNGSTDCYTVFSMGRKRLWDFLIRATDYATVMSQTAMPDTVTTLLIRGHILI